MQKNLRRCAEEIMEEGAEALQKMYRRIPEDEQKNPRRSTEITTRIPEDTALSILIDI